MKKRYFFEFEKADFSQYGKPAGTGCDRLILLKKPASCEIILIECKSGRLSISDYERGKRQLEDSIDSIFKMFGENPDLAVICYDKMDPYVTQLLRGPKLRLKYQVNFIFKKRNDQYCKGC